MSTLSKYKKCNSNAADDCPVPKHTRSKAKIEVITNLQQVDINIKGP